MNEREGGDAHDELLRNSAVRLRDLNEAARVLLAEKERAEAEVERLKRGGKQLGHIIDQQCRMVLNATGLHDWIDEDGDGDWGAIWENLLELKPRAERAEAERAEAERAEAERAEAERDLLRALVERIRAMHSEHEYGYCNDCEANWPCPTIRALDTAGGDQP